MKSIIGLGFVLSVLGATSAIAAPHASLPVVAAAKVSQPATLNVNTVGVDRKDTQASTLYVGPYANLVEGADLSWLVGLVVTSPLYYCLATRGQGQESKAAKLGYTN